MGTATGVSVFDGDVSDIGSVVGCLVAVGTIGDNDMVGTDVLVAVGAIDNGVAVSFG